MLMITTAVRLEDDKLVAILEKSLSKISYVVNWIHGNTTGLRPRVSFDCKLVFCTRCLCKHSQYDPCRTALVKA